MMMKGFMYSLVAFGASSNAWAQAAQEARPAGYYAGYVLGIVLFVYLVSRAFRGGKKRG